MMIFVILKVVINKKLKRFSEVSMFWVGLIIESRINMSLGIMV